MNHPTPATRGSAERRTCPPLLWLRAQSTASHQNPSSPQGLLAAFRSLPPTTPHTPRHSPHPMSPTMYPCFPRKPLMVDSVVPGLWVGVQPQALPPREWLLQGECGCWSCSPPTADGGPATAASRGLCPDRATGHVRAVRWLCCGHCLLHGSSPLRGSRVLSSLH